MLKDGHVIEGLLPADAAVLAPDERRAERVRARCRARHAPRPAKAAQRPFGPAIFAGLCLLYLSAILHDVLQVIRF